MYIVCGKLDNYVGLGPFSSHVGASRRLHKSRKAPDIQALYLPISVGSSGIWFDGCLWEIGAFLLMASAKAINRLIVLTNREYLQCVERVTAHGMHVDVFEINFPIFSDIKYSSSLRTNLNVLEKNLRKLDQLGICSRNLNKHLSDRYSRTVVRKVRFKNGYDRDFFFAYKDAYQEVFKFKDERPDRVIVALDFNSMYLDSMQGRFCNPASIKYRSFLGASPEVGDLDNGIYRVRLLSAKPTFLLEYHPFRYKRLGRSFYFELNCGDTIETLLHKDEIVYYSPFFERVEIIEGLFSADTIEHPLLKDGLELYAQRLYHRRRGDRIKEDLSKISLQHMHSATNQKRFAKKNFTTLCQLAKFLSVRFAMNLDEVDMDQLVDFLNWHKYFQLTRIPQGYQLSYLDADAGSNILSLSAQVVSNARLKMMRMLERFLSFRSVELCYVNVDSIHLSIHKDDVEPFLNANRELISEKLGSLKVEAIADTGYWFDVGRYWLKKNGEVVLFKNKGFNYQGASSPFVYRRKVSSFIEAPTFVHFRTYVTKLDNSFNYHKRLEHLSGLESRLVRFRYGDISEIHAANLTEAREQLNSKKDKVALFRRISSSTSELDDVKISRDAR